MEKEICNDKVLINYDGTISGHPKILKAFLKEELNFFGFDEIDENSEYRTIIKNDRDLINKLDIIEDTAIVTLKINGIDASYDIRGIDKGEINMSKKIDIFSCQNKYSIIYADPPWTYKVWSKKGQGRSAESHYPTMQKEDIQKLPVQKIAADNSVLFLWVTAPCLEEGLELIEKWGFQYKTIGFTWIKQNKKSDSLFWGMGYYTRANAELCLIATKGKPLPRISRSVHQVILSHIEEHSKKPQEARDRIVELFGDLPRIELFARQYAEGWDCWRK